MVTHGVQAQAKVPAALQVKCEASLEKLMGCAGPIKGSRCAPGEV